jgi:hypothetical protein
MEADTAVWLAFGLALFLISAVPVAALCRMALRRGDEFEIEIKAPLFSLKIHVRPNEGALLPLHGQRTRGDESATREPPRNFI